MVLCTENWWVETSMSSPPTVGATVIIATIDKLMGRFG